MTGAPRSVIWTLIRREIATRFGAEALSYLWAMVIPLSWIGFGVFAFAFFDHSVPLATSPAVFLATGVLPYIIFRQTVIYVTRATIAAKRLVDLPRVQIFHLIWAYAILEGLTVAAVTIIVLILLGLGFQAGMPHDAPLFIFTLIATWGFACIIGATMALAALRYGILSRLLPLLLRPLFWVSGVFFLASELPIVWRDALSLNPLFFLTDQARAAYFADYTSPLHSGLPLGVTIMASVLLSFALLSGPVKNPHEARV